MGQPLSVVRHSSSPACTHGKQSAQLRFDPRGLLTAVLVCDDCGLTMRHLQHQSTDAQQQRLQSQGSADAA